MEPSKRGRLDATIPRPVTQADLDEANATIARLEWVLDAIIRVIDGYAPAPPPGGWKEEPTPVARLGAKQP